MGTGRQTSVCVRVHPLSSHADLPYHTRFRIPADNSSSQNLIPRPSIETMVSIRIENKQV